MKQKIHTENAPLAIGTYSQAIKAGNMIYFSGQIPLDPKTGELVPGDFAAQTLQVFANIKSVCEAAGGCLSDIVKLTIFLTDLKNFSVVNDIMKRFFAEPYPARSTVQISALPKGAEIEVEALMVK